MADDNSWVFDSLVCFLHGPVWNAPLQTFIEDKSIVFDPNVKPDEGNPEFRRVHDEYKNLVDYMLGSFMDEMQITPEQFEFACLEGRNSSTAPVASSGDGANQGGNTFSFHQGLFQQIWAANDIRIFIRMMVQRNVEIQLQALDLIERRQATQAAAQQEASGGSDAGKSDEVTGDVQVISTEVDDIGESSSEGELEQDIIKSVDVEAAVPFAPLPNGPVAEVIEDGGNDKFQRLNLFFDQEKINSEDIKARQEYLRAQRDKILQIKKKARARQLNETIKRSERPASAQVAQKILDGDTETVPPEPPESSLQLRKMLAQRLRSEVIEKE